MSRIKLVLTCITLAILIVLVLAACAPAATEPAKPAATEPAKPAATEPAKPATTTPPATPATTAPVIKTSYEAKTYANDKYGFSFQYPASMTVAATPKGTYNVFEAADAMGVPGCNVGIYDTDKLDEQAVENTASTGGSDLKEVSTKEVTLADGKTKAKLQETACKSSGYDISIISMGVDMPGGKSMSVAYYSLKDMIDLKVAEEVVNTLVFK